MEELCPQRSLSYLFILKMDEYMFLTYTLSACTEDPSDSVFLYSE